MVPRGGLVPGVQERHREALERNRNAPAWFTPGPGGYALDLHRAYQEALSELEAFKSRRRPAGPYKVNLAFIPGDPFLSLHNQDLGALVPDPVTDEEWAALKAALANAIPAGTPAGRAQWRSDLELFFLRLEATRGEARGQLRKRVKRLFDHARRRTEAGLPPLSAAGENPLEELVFDLTQNPGGCLDGQRWVLAQAEEKAFGEESQPPHLGQVISQVLTDFKTAFVERHAALFGDERETPLYAAAHVRTKMLRPLGLRGEPVPLQYALGVSLEFEAALQPRRIMKRFLEGEANVRATVLGFLNPGRRPAVTFEPYTPELMVSLLQKARERGFSEARGRPRREPGPRVSNALLAREIPRHEEIRDLWAEFLYPVEEGPIRQPFFLPPVGGDHPDNYRLTEAFWYYMLEKYQYVLPVDSRSSPVAD
jgi:hypothetical protein